MADDITYTVTSPAGVPNSTKQVTDEHASRGHMPVVKLAYSADGDASLVTADANGLEVQVSNASIPVTDNGGSLTVDGSVAVSSLPALAAGTANIGDVDVLTVPAPLSTTGGGTEAAALRVTVATDSTGVLSVDDNGSSLTVDGTVAATQSGTWTLGANSGVDVGDVTINNASGASAVNIQDGGNSITVDGTVAVSGTVAVTDNAGSLTVDYATTGSGTATGALRVELPTNGTGVLATVGTVSSVTAVGTTTPGTGATNLGKAIDSAAGATDTVVGAGVLRDDVLTTLTPADSDYTHMRVNSMGAQWTQLHPATTGGLSIFRSIDLDETEEDVKTSAGMVYGYYAFNAAASTRFIKFYNATAANVTVGSTTPVITLPLSAGAAANLTFPMGVAFSTAICAAATTGVADNDTGAPGANEVILNVFYA